MKNIPAWMVSSNTAREKARTTRREEEKTPPGEKVATDILLVLARE